MVILCKLTVRGGLSSAVDVSSLWLAFVALESQAAVVLVCACALKLKHRVGLFLWLPFSAMVAAVWRHWSVGHCLAVHSGRSPENYIYVLDTMIDGDCTFKVNHKVVDAQGFF